ncbi:MAG: transglycosylase domain-containing protein [Lachnospiraceae bacterium]|jgi:penicillin-binding protein 1A
MDYRKKSTIAELNRLTSPGRKVSSKLNVWTFRLVLVVFIAIILFGTMAVLGVCKGIIDTAPDIDTIDVSPEGYSTKIYDTDGNVTQTLIGQNANRVYVTLDNVPAHVQNAFIAIEDERFRQHNGIDIKGIIRAAANTLSTKDLSQGASTITQQLIKNTVFEGGSENTDIAKIKRKIQEQYLAVQLENKINKDTILEYYLNTINLGQNTLGVQAASQRYFGKNVNDLTISEAAVIAGITKNPSGNNPISYPENNKERRATVLEYMKEQGYIDEAEYNEALADNVYDRIAEYNESYISAKGNEQTSSYFNDALFEQVLNDLKVELGYTETQAYNALYRAGLKIYSTQDRQIQDICDEVTNDSSFYPSNSEYQLSYQLSVISADGTETNYNEQTLKAYFLKQNPSFNIYFKDKKSAKPYIKEYRKSVVKDTDTITGENINYIIQPQVSFVLMDQHNGHVLALVGGRGKKTGARTLNRASGSLRQPGSTFKILSTYLPAFDTAGMTLASTEVDEKYYYPGTKVQVHNWTGSAYKGTTTLREGIYNSMNVVTVKTLAKVTPKVAYDYLVNLGITTLVDSRIDKSGKVFSDIQLPMALGGLTDGVTNLELTAAYASIANGGVYTEPVLYTRILDHDGNVLIDKTPVTRQVFKDSTAYLLTSAMEDVISIGTGTAAKFTGIDMPAAGKTGTTSKDIDLWFEGYTPYYTAGIWGGWDLNKDQVNTTYHKTIWKTIMERVHTEKNLEKKEFDVPDSVSKVSICRICGKLAVEGVCSSYGSEKTEYFAKDTIPKEYCSCHQTAAIINKPSKPKGTE